MNFEYIFRWGWEIFWAVVVAVALTLAQIVSAADPGVVLADPQAWVISTVGALARVAVAAVGVAIRKIFSGGS